MRYAWIVCLLFLFSCQAGNVTYVDEGPVDDYVPPAPVVDAPVQIEEPEGEVPYVQPRPQHHLDIVRVVAQGTIFQDKYYMNRLQIEVDTDLAIEDLHLAIENPHFASLVNYTDDYGCERVTNLVRDAQRHFAGSVVNDTIHICVGTPRMLQPSARMNISLMGAVNDTVAVQLPAVLSGLEYEIYP